MLSKLPYPSHSAPPLPRPNSTNLTPRDGPWVCGLPSFSDQVGKSHKRDERSHFLRYLLEGRG